MINEPTKHLQRFIDTCSNNVLLHEALELLISTSWFFAPHTFAPHHSSLRTEQMFVDYRNARAADKRQ